MIMIRVTVGLKYQDRLQVTFTGNIHHAVVPSWGLWNISGTEKYVWKREGRMTMSEKRRLLSRQFLWHYSVHGTGCY